MSPEQKEALVAAIRDALSIVIDPELGESLVNLGLIYEIAIGDGGTTRITMTTTTPGCPAADFLMGAVQAAVQKVDGVQHVDLRLTYEPPWTAEMASEEARLRLSGGGSLIGYASHTTR
jgi:metal-sulfur cluster biosynthetic enzyme